MKFTTGLLLILLIVGLMTLSRRRKAGSENKLSGPYAGPSAAEQEPTATGRYRVKQMLEKTKGQEVESPSQQIEDAEFEEVLPDPYGNGSGGSTEKK